MKPGNPRSFIVEPVLSMERYEEGRRKRGAGDKGRKKISINKSERKGKEGSNVVNIDKTVNFHF